MTERRQRLDLAPESFHGAERNGSECAQPSELNQQLTRRGIGYGDPLEEQASGVPNAMLFCAGMRSLRTPSGAPALPPIQQNLQEISRPRPFVKWAGGKRQLLKELHRRVPSTFNTYHEPFVGGGALFFSLCPRAAVLGDANLRLMRTYRAIQQQVDEVISELSDMPAAREFFLAQRKRPIDDGSDAEVAAWFIYLNRTAYNGLYRVNKRGQFNVPFGRYENPTICDRNNLRACSAALSTVSLRPADDFASVLDRAEPGDFVYFDPPYIPVSANSSFTRYTPESNFDSLTTSDCGTQRWNSSIVESTCCFPTQQLPMLSRFTKGVLRSKCFVRQGP